MPIWSPAFFGSAAGSSGFAVEDSVWFDASADFMTWTPGSAATSRRKQTWSWWQKLSLVSKSSTWIMVMGNATSGYFGFYQNPGDHYFAFTDVNGSTVYNVTSNIMFRDPTAWMHLCVGIDTTQGSIGDRFVLEVNGVAHTSWSSNTLVQNTDLDFGDNGEAMYLGSQTSSPGNVFNGYLAQFAFVDGTKHNAATFTETNDEGILIPKNLASESITWGTNGFLLEFKETGSGQDANGIGADTSGRNNHWAVGGGAIQNNQVTDSPTNDSDNDIGNYATLNPLGNSRGQHITGTLSAGNLTWASPSSSGGVFGTIVLDQTKEFYWEVTVNTTASVIFVGIASTNLDTPASMGSGTFATYRNNGTKNVDASGSAYGAAWSNGNVIGIHFDGPDDEITFYVNDSSQGAISFTAADQYFPFFNFGASSSASISVNFGQAAFSYTPKGGSVRLNTANILAPTVTDPSAYYQTAIWTGNGTAIGSGGQTITFGGNSDMVPDFVWVKRRNEARNHQLYTSVIGWAKANYPDLTDAVGNISEGVTAVTSDGFTVGNNGGVNESSDTYVAWCLKAGGAPSADNTGDRTPTNNSVMKGGVAQTASNYFAAADLYPKRMSIAAHGGFSILKYTGTNSTVQTIPHGLDTSLPDGGKPGMIIVKRLDNTDSWCVMHRGVASDYYDYNLSLNANDARDDNATKWNDTEPTTTLVTLGTDDGVNSTDNYVMYCFARTPGLIGIGSYTGNASTDGPNIIIDDGASGFRPAFILEKRTDAAGAWYITDVARNTYNPVNLFLMADSNAVDGTGTTSSGAYLDVTANGYKIRGTSSGQEYNRSGTYIYLCFAEQPFSLNNRAR